MTEIVRAEANYTYKAECALEFAIIVNLSILINPLTSKDIL